MPQNVTISSGTPAKVDASVVPRIRRGSNVDCNGSKTIAYSMHVSAWSTEERHDNGTRHNRCSILTHTASKGEANKLNAQHKWRRNEGVTRGLTDPSINTSLKGAASTYVHDDGTRGVPNVAHRPSGDRACHEPCMHGNMRRLDKYVANSAMSCCRRGWCHSTKWEAHSG